jgi:hypothetical protein
MKSRGTAGDIADMPSLKRAISGWYGGYSWDGVNRVLNPFSLLNFLKKSLFGKYWYATGSPRFLIELVRKEGS